jgi:dihydroorotase
MSHELLIREALVVLPDREVAQRDLLVRGERIAAIAPEIMPSGDPDQKVIDGKGLVLMAGVIDPQVHFREPGLEHKEDLQTASYACAKGGVTSFLEMPNTRPTTTTQEYLADKLRRAQEKSVVNYGFFIGANGKNIADLQTAHPVCGVKVFMGSMHGELLIDQEQVLEEIFRSVPRLIAVHAEDQERIRIRRTEFLAGANEHNYAIHSQIQDETAALLATQKAVALSHRYQRRLHILHLSTGMEVEYLRSSKSELITCEVTPQHLFLDTSAYQHLGSFAQMNPPLRSADNCVLLWEGLLDGTIDLIATDHAPHTRTEKAQPYPQSPSGMPGVETSLALMLTAAMTGKCSIAQVSEWMSQRPAEAYQIKERGQIRPDWYADLILVDVDTWKPVKNEELMTKCGWSPFAGWNLTGWVDTTIVNGMIAYSKGKIHPHTRGKALEFSMEL